MKSIKFVIYTLCSSFHTSDLWYLIRLPIRFVIISQCYGLHTSEVWYCAELCCRGLKASDLWLLCVIHQICACAASGAGGVYINMLLGHFREYTHQPTSEWPNNILPCFPDVCGEKFILTCDVFGLWFLMPAIWIFYWLHWLMYWFFSGLHVRDFGQQFVGYADGWENRCSNLHGREIHIVLPGVIWNTLWIETTLGCDNIRRFSLDIAISLRNVLCGLMLRHMTDYACVVYYFICELSDIRAHDGLCITSLLPIHEHTVYTFVW